MNRTLFHPLFRKLLLIVALAGLSFQVAHLAITVGEGVTIKSFFRAGSRCLPFLVLLTVLSVLPPLPFSLPRGRLQFSLKELIPTILLSLAVSALTLLLAREISFSHASVILTTIGIVCIAIYSVFRQRLIYGLTLFFLLLPLLSLWEWIYRHSLFGAYGSWSQWPILLTPTAIVLYSLSLALSLQLLKPGTAPLMLDTITAQIKQSPINRAILVWVLINLMGVLFSQNPQGSLRQFVIEICLPLSAYFLVSHCRVTQKQLIIFLYAVLFFVVVTVAINFSMILGREHGIAYGNLFSLTFGGASSFLVVLSAPIAMFLALRSRGIRMLIHFLLIAGLFLAEALHYSRLGLIALLASLSVYFRRKRFIYIAALAGLLIAIQWNYVFETFLWRFSSIDSLGALSLKALSSTRYYAWKAAIDIMRDHPLTGIGLGEWPNNYFAYGPSMYFMGKQWVTFAHNQFLHYGAETGLLGLFGWILLLWTIFRQCLAWLKTSVPGFDRELARAVLGSLLGFLLFNLLGSAYFATETYIGGGLLFWTWIGLISLGKRGLIPSEEQVETKCT